jgi:hypothetical protein
MPALRVGRVIGDWYGNARERTRVMERDRVTLRATRSLHIYLATIVVSSFKVPGDDER